MFKVHCCMSTKMIKFVFTFRMADINIKSFQMEKKIILQNNMNYLVSFTNSFFKTIIWFLCYVLTIKLFVVENFPHPIKNAQS